LSLRNCFQLVAVLAIAIWILGPIGCQADDNATEAAKVQAVYHAMNKANLADDYTTYCKLLTPESVDQLVAGMMGAADATRAVQNIPGHKPDAEQVAMWKRMEPILKKYKIDLDEAHKPAPAEAPASDPATAEAAPLTAEKEAAPVDDANASGTYSAYEYQWTKVAQKVQDKPGFLREIFKAVESPEVRKARDEMAKKPPEDLTRITISGNQAIGHMPFEHQGKTIEVPYRFRKIDGEWKVDLVQPRAAREGGAGEQ